MTQFTPLEIELLKHRLAVPDALCDALADDEDDSLARLAITDDGVAVETACTNILAKIERMFSAEQIVSEASPLERWVLTDVIEGSTWVACHSEESPGRRANAKRAAFSVVQKLRTAGLEVGDVPIY